MTFCTLERGAGTGLGLKTDRGILDVAAAEERIEEKTRRPRSAPSLPAPATLAGLKRLRDRAAASRFVAEDKAKFGPCVTNPEKIVCIGLNYRKHAAETGQPVPAQPILFNKYNTRAQLLRRRDRRVQGEGGEIRLRGRAGDRDRPHARRNVAEADALKLHFRLLPPATTSPRATCSRARANGCSAKRSTARRPVGPLARHGRSGRRRQPQDRMPRQRRGAPVLEHLATWCSTASSS